MQPDSADASCSLHTPLLLLSKFQVLLWARAPDRSTRKPHTL